MVLASPNTHFFLSSLRPRRPRRRGAARLENVAFSRVLLPDKLTTNAGTKKEEEEGVNNNGCHTRLRWAAEQGDEDDGGGGGGGHQDDEGKDIN